MSAIWSSVAGNGGCLCPGGHFNDFADEVAHSRRGRELWSGRVGATGAGSVRAMAESAGLRELFLSRSAASAQLAWRQLLGMGARTEQAGDR